MGEALTFEQAKRLAIKLLMVNYEMGHNPLESVEKWLKEEHCGDCTHVPAPCSRCFAEQLHQESEPLVPIIMESFSEAAASLRQQKEQSEQSAWNWKNTAKTWEKANEWAIKERDKALAELAALREVKKAGDELAKALGMVEWSEAGGDRHCPSCGGYHIDHGPVQHYPGCRTKKALAAYNALSPATQEATKDGKLS